MVVTDIDLQSLITSTAFKVSKYGIFSGPNTGKYGPEKAPYWDTFHAVISNHPKDRVSSIKRYSLKNYKKKVIRGLNVKYEKKKLSLSFTGTDRMKLRY